MSKTKNIVAILTENKIQLLITLVSVAIAAINFLIVSRLAPVSQDIAVIATRVSALESREYVAHDEWDRRISEVDKRLERIETKLDRFSGM